MKAFEAALIYDPRFGTIESGQYNVFIDLEFGGLVFMD